MQKRYLVFTGAVLACGLVLATAGCLTGEEPVPGVRITTASTARPPSTQPLATDAAAQHAALIHDEGPYVSAAKCATCHPNHYREWSVSPHAYAQISPVFNSMQAAVLFVTNGTNGDFCIRCHSPVGMALGEPIVARNVDRHPVSREGITCIVCHRIKGSFGKVSGRQGLPIGDIFEPVYGPTGDNQNLEKMGLRIARDATGRGIRGHGRVDRHDQMSKSGFCGSCHDVTLMNGFRLEDAFSEYKTSPAARRGESCQDCHMGYDPGVPGSYRIEPAAIVAGQETAPRKRTNHMFVGPDYSVVHPAIFPHNPDASKMATLEEWLTFDWKAGWGTDEFEDNVADDFSFPERWTDDEERFTAREEIIDMNLDLLHEAEKDRRTLLRRGYTLSDITVDRADESGIRFHVRVGNGTDGHGVPTGFDAERLVFLRVTVTDREGTVVMQSGDLDPNGDVRDSHSVYVHNHELPRDEQLFSLQSKFLVRMVRGGEREQVLPLNISADPLLYIRPATNSAILTGRPGGVRKHKQGIAPGDSRRATYRVKGSELTGKGPYKARVELVAAMVPVNLIHAIQIAGFEYGFSARSLADAIVHGLDTGVGGRIEGDPENDLTGHMTLHEREAIFAVHASSGTPAASE